MVEVMRLEPADVACARSAWVLPLWRYNEPSEGTGHYVELASDRFKGLLAMKLRLSDAAASAVLAEHYRTQAEVCHQMARMIVSPFKESWLELAAEWTKLAQEQQAEVR